MFTKNRYYYVYQMIVLNAKFRFPPEGYLESHHIVPKCLGGRDDSENLVLLTAREHFVCHHLLTKFTEGRNHHKMVLAFVMMAVGSNRHDRITSRRAAILRADSAAARSSLLKGKKRTPEQRKRISEAMKGRPSPKKGTKLSDEQRRAMSESRKGKGPSPETVMKILESRKDYRHSEETKKKIGLAHRGKTNPPCSDETRKKLSEAGKGKKRGPDTVARMKESAAKREKKQCTHCGGMFYAGLFARWHGDRCKFKST